MRGLRTARRSHEAAPGISGLLNAVKSCSVNIVVEQEEVFNAIGRSEHGTLFKRLHKYTEHLSAQPEWIQ